MTREEILQTFSDINHAYNNSTKYDTLKRMLDELTEPCEDCISRAEAIKALEYDLSIEADGGLDKYRTVIKDLLNAIYNTQKKAIEDLPGVQPIRPKGHWIPMPYTIEWETDARCSNCRRGVAGGLWYDTCPYCSADMRESEDT